MAETEQINMVKKASKTEMILHGPMYSVLLMISFPLIVNNLIMTLYNMADAYFVGQLGTTEFAAVSFVNPVMFLFQAIGMGVQIAGTSILAQLVTDLWWFDSVGYRQVWEALDAQAASDRPLDMHGLRERGIAATRQLAKRQITWLRSMPQRRAIACDAPDALAQLLQGALALLPGT